MAFLDPILGEISFELPTTLRVLERVPGDKLDWAPHAKSMTIGRLAWHIAGIPLRVQTMLEAGDFDIVKAGAPPMPADAKEFPPTLQRNMDSLLAYLRSQDEATLKSQFTLRMGEKVLQQVPKIAIVRSILLNHSYHHRGQLSVYLRLLDIPVPVIYGRSADEGPS
ncbi:MAG: damage-inducible protein DinB [Acidobacteria bacterium]|nr:MAG: damage-inducible protein DinB [Acidobacteriota bacterium]